MTSRDYLFGEVQQAHREELAAESALTPAAITEASLRLTRAVSDHAGGAGFPRALLQIFSELGRSTSCQLFVREGEELVLRTSLGETAPSSAAEATLPVVDMPFEGAEVLEAEPDDGGVRCRLPLFYAEQPIGLMLLEWRSSGDVPADGGRALRVLATAAGSALAHHLRIDDLRQTIRARDDVLSVVAHDLQNPINVISLAANSLLQRLPDASARRSIDRIVRGAQRASRMVRDLQEVSAIETGRFVVERRRVEPTDLILAAVESQQSLAAEASIIIASDVSPELPSIEADEERLLEVLENLIGNAIKFTAAGGSITVGAEPTDQAILVSVSDNGAGIAARELPHIFDRFWQAKKKARRGTGLGLTICKAIVEAHGGRIWAESEPGAGTTVHFTIPASGERLARSSDIANVLVVDDRPENLVALSAILERPDYRVVTATSGDEALRLALRERFAVALIDVSMPGMSGFDVAVHLKNLERSRDLPILFITAFGDDPEEIHRAYSAGAADYLVKPLDIEIVRKKVAVFVDLSRRRRRSIPPPA